MSAGSADWRAVRDRMRDDLVEPMSRPHGPAMPECSKLLKWLEENGVHEEDRAELARMMIMTASVPEEVQPTYAADMKEQIDQRDGPEELIEMFRWFARSSRWAMDQAAAITAAAPEETRGHRPEGAKWAEEALADEEHNVARTMAAVLETNAALPDEDGWTTEEATGVATELVAILAVENVCEFVGHLA